MSGDRSRTREVSGHGLWRGQEPSHIARHLWRETSARGTGEMSPLPWAPSFVILRVLTKGASPPQVASICGVAGALHASGAESAGTDDLSGLSPQMVAPAADPRVPQRVVWWSGK